jgi:hypothetical protein
MIHLKGFNDLSEAIDRSISYTPDEIKQMPEYIDLLNSTGIRDTSSPAIAKAGNIRFQEKDSDMTFTIHSNGHIRYQRIEKSVPWGGGGTMRGTPGIYVTPGGEKLNDILYGNPIKSNQDYIPKFEYIKRLVAKRNGEPLPTQTSEYINTRLNDLISNDPSIVKNPAVAKLIRKGIFNPDDYSKIVVSASDFGLI